MISITTTVLLVSGVKMALVLTKPIIKTKKRNVLAHLLIVLATIAAVPGRVVMLKRRVLVVVPVLNVMTREIVMLPVSITANVAFAKSAP